MSNTTIKCDGNHGGPRCADPECWNDTPANTDGRFAFGSDTREWARMGPDGRHLETFNRKVLIEDAPTHPVAAMLLAVHEHGVARSRYAPAPKLGSTEQVDSTWLAQLRREYLEYAQAAGESQAEGKLLKADLELAKRELAERTEENADLLRTVQQLRQHKTDYMEAAEETSRALRADIERQLRQLGQCDAMADVIEGREVSEKFDHDQVANKVERVITSLHRELCELKARPTVAYSIAGNRYMVATTRGELPDVYEDAQVIELVYGRPYTRPEPQV